MWATKRRVVYAGVIVHQSVRNLGVIFDSFFKFDKQISYILKNIFFQLRLLAKVMPYFITSRPVCDSLFSDVEQCINLNVFFFQCKALWSRLVVLKRFEYI